MTEISHIQPAAGAPPNTERRHTSARVEPRISFFAIPLIAASGWLLTACTILGIASFENVSLAAAFTFTAKLCGLAALGTAQAAIIIYGLPLLVILLSGIGIYYLTNQKISKTQHTTHCQKQHLQNPRGHAIEPAANEVQNVLQQTQNQSECDIKPAADALNVLQETHAAKRSPVLLGLTKILGPLIMRYLSYHEVNILRQLSKGCQNSLHTYQSQQHLENQQHLPCRLPGRPNALERARCSGERPDYSRSTLKHLSLDMSAVIETPIIQKEGDFPKLKSLQITQQPNCTRAEVPPLSKVVKNLPNNRDLTSLNFTGCHFLVVDQEFASLTACQSLETLNLRDCRLVSDNCLEHLKKLPNLTSLDITGCYEMTYKALQDLVAAMPKLTTLFLGGQKGFGGQVRVKDFDFLTKNTELNIVLDATGERDILADIVPQLQKKFGAQRVKAILIAPEGA